MFMVQVISQTAIQEFKVGSAERGRSMFESCLRNYPARLDVWSQYLDQVRIITARPPSLRHMETVFLLAYIAALVWAESISNAVFQFAIFKEVGHQCLQNDCCC